jgi:hypothetical protein
MTSRETFSLTAGTSSERSTASSGGAISPRLLANVTTRVALAMSVRVADEAAGRRFRR